jgi:inner membrane protein
MDIVQPSLFERVNTWIRESIMIKLVSIGFLLLILLIPQAWIESLIRERQYRAQAVVDEIASKWSGEQTVTAPVLVIPFLKREKIDKGKDGYEIREWKESSYFLPDELSIDGKVKPQIFYRGIFDAAVYESSLAVSAQFNSPDFQKLNVAEGDILWKEAYLVAGISDLRGISENPKIQVGQSSLTGEPSNNIGLTSEFKVTKQSDDENNSGYAVPATDKTSESGIVLPLSWKSRDDFQGKVSMEMALKGSTQLYFVPVGKTTNVRLEGPWASPSFDGSFIPSTREVTTAGFSATWKILHYNRPFAQQWVGSSQKLSGSDFGVRLVIPVDQYQKSIRTAKYGVLVILLTFISLFMVEIIRKVRIHPFQYILVGAALIIYYSLLLSLSEHVGYDNGYLIASISTVVLIALYSSTFLSPRSLVILFGGLLCFFYAFIFVIIQMQDYSLLLGSTGLFATIALIMYFSRRINWYKD